MGKKVDFWLGVLNGAVGDHLARTANELATEMAFFQGGSPLDPATVNAASPRVVVLVHGLMCTESVWSMDDGEDYGTLLARELGVTSLYVRYNSGRAIPDNGAALDALLDALIARYPAPIEEITLIGYSMGGLVVRSAARRAKPDGWLAKARHAIYVGTPHAGAPLERAGRVVNDILGRIDDPYTQLASDIARLRSTGIKDLGDGDPVPLVESMRHALIAGALGQKEWSAMLFGDGMVPLASAIHPALPPERVRVAKGLSHLSIARSREVYAHIKELLG